MSKRAQKRWRLQIQSLKDLEARRENEQANMNKGLGMVSPSYVSEWRRLAEPPATTAERLEHLTAEQSAVVDDARRSIIATRQVRVGEVLAEAAAAMAAAAMVRSHPLYPNPFAAPALASALARKPSPFFGGGVDPVKVELLKQAVPYKVQPPKRPMPDYMEVLTAWRAWDTTKGDGKILLEGFGTTVTWPPLRQIVAHCNDSDHAAPRFNCYCGMWAFKSLDILMNVLRSGTNGFKTIKVFGTVSLWGKVIETENGYRAEMAYPAELWLTDPAYEELGFTYNVPVRLIKPEGS